MALFISEMVFTHTGYIAMVDLYCVGRKITKLELKKPWLYVYTRFDSIFERCDPKYISKPIDEMECKLFGYIDKRRQIQHVDYSSTNANIIVNILNVLKFLFTISWSVRDQTLPK